MKDRIRTIMEHVNLSQQNFAERIGMSASSLSSIFTGRTNPTNKHVYAIHNAFPEINVNWLLFGEGDMLLPLAADGGNASPANAPMPQNVGEVGAQSAQKEPDMFLQMEMQPANADPQRGVQRAANRPMLGHRDVLVQPQMVGSIPSTAKFIDKPVRKIKEIRVFFDDGTYEAFVPSSK